MNKAKISGIGWVELDTRTNGFYYGSDLVIDCYGKILDSRIITYLIFD